MTSFIILLLLFNGSMSDFRCVPVFKHTADGQLVNNGCYYIKPFNGEYHFTYDTATRYDYLYFHKSDSSINNISDFFYSDTFYSTAISGYEEYLDSQQLDDIYGIIYNFFFNILFEEEIITHSPYILGPLKMEKRDQKIYLINRSNPDDIQEHILFSLNKAESVDVSRNLLIFNDHKKYIKTCDIEINGNLKSCYQVLTSYPSHDHSLRFRVEYYNIITLLLERVDYIDINERKRFLRFGNDYRLAEWVTNKGNIILEIGNDNDLVNYLTEDFTSFRNALYVCE